MRFGVSILMFFIVLGAYAQGPANNWYFGGGAGINFNTSPPTVLTDGRLNTLEGCASISNDDGELLFYTDGSTVYTRTGAIMDNGTGLFGDQSSTQSAIIIPQPLSTTIYYIFTVDILRVDQEENISSNGVNYSIVDFSSNPNGEITSKNINLLEYSAEKLSAVIKGCDSDTVWMVTLSTPSTMVPTINNAESLNTYYAYAVTPEGINRSPVISPVGGAIFDRRGNLKFSPNGKKLAAAHARSGMDLLDFNSETGRISNPVRIEMNSEDFAPYGVEFSPNSRFLYVHSSNDGTPNSPASFNTSSLFQYDLDQANVAQSQVLLDSQNIFRGSLQLGPDGKIYRALSSAYLEGLPYLGIIENPNEQGLASNYRDRAIFLGNRISYQGLPPFNQSLFNKIDIIRNNESNRELHLCSDESYTLNYEQVSGADYTWYKDGVVISGQNTHQLTVRAVAGNSLPYTEVYELVVNLNDGSCEKTGEAEITFYPYPTPPASLRLVQCQDAATATGLSIFNLNELVPELTGNNDLFTVSFYENTTDANTTTNAITPFGYRNLVPTQRLFARVTNRADCTVIVPFELVVSTTRAENVLLERCDENDNGIMSFDLTQANPGLLTGQTIDIDISYYSTSDGALLEDPAYRLPSRYENVTPFNQTIYARLENNNACFAVSEIRLQVNRRPVFTLDNEVIYCTNTFPATISVQPNLNLDPNRIYTYQWLPEGQTTSQLVTNLTGRHSLTVTDAATGCSNTETINIIEHDIAVIENIAVKDGASINSAVVTISGRGEFEYALDRNGPYQDNNEFRDLVPGFYNVYIRSKSNCGITEGQFSIIGFPEFFTPNGDGYNDIWQIKGINAVNKPQTPVRIYDRYGKLLKELDPLGAGWDGTFNGAVMPADDYWFYIILQDGREFKSNFSIVR